MYVYCIFGGGSVCASILYFKWYFKNESNTILCLYYTYTSACVIIIVVMQSMSGKCETSILLLWKLNENKGASKDGAKIIFIWYNE
jgi:hypothetical protein